MNLQKLKEIIDQYKNKIIIKGKNFWRIKYNIILFKEINSKYPNLFCKINELIYLVKNYNNLENLHIFCYCGKKNKFRCFKHGYAKYCSNVCQVHDFNFIQNRKLNKDFIYKKAINTKLNNIDKNGLNSIQRGALKQKFNRLNKIDKNGLNSYERWKIKFQQNYLNKYGVNNPWKNKVIIEKIKQIKKNANSYQRMYLKKINNIDENGLNSIERAKIKEYQTKKKNHTFNTSKYEEQIYNYLLKKFNKDDIIRQYRSKQYQFNCDFYIKSLDLYIEYHGTWTHYNKPFKNSIEDLIELEKLKEKANEINFKGKKKDYYKNVIYTWTKLDPLKLQTFKKNKLNYKIFYKIEQFLNWFNKIKI